MDRTVVVLRSPSSSSGWQEQALCAQTDPEGFFPEVGGSPRAAKAVCRRCLVKDHCLDTALGGDELFGIWGGLSREERTALNRRRPGTGGVA